MKLFLATLLTISGIKILFVETIIHSIEKASYANNKNTNLIARSV